MTTVATILLVSGLLIMFFAWMWVAWIASRKHVLWGVGIVLMPFVWVFYLGHYWYEAIRPTRLWFIGLAVAAFGFVGLKSL